MQFAKYLLVIGIFTSVSTSDSANSEERFQRLNAQAMIDACWDETRELRAGSTADAREGILLSALCLEERILDQFEMLFAPGVLTRDDAADHLKTIRKSYGSLYWKLYNEHQGCDACGTQYHTVHVDAYSRLLEQILRDAVDQRNQYKF